MSRSAISHEQFGGSGGHWHPGMGSHGPDKGYAGPGGTVEGAHPQVIHSESGHSRPRGNTQSADPTIKDAAHRHNVQASPRSERNGPAGVVRVSRSYSEHDYAATGRNVKLLPSAKGNTDFRRTGGE